MPNDHSFSVGDAILIWFSQSQSITFAGTESKKKKKTNKQNRLLCLDRLSKKMKKDLRDSQLSSCWCCRISLFGRAIEYSTLSFEPAWKSCRVLLGTAVTHEKERDCVIFSNRVENWFWSPPAVLIGRSNRKKQNKKQRQILSTDVVCGGSRL